MQRLAGLDQRLFVVEELLRHLAREEIEIGLADQVARRRRPCGSRPASLQAVKRLCASLA